jgi:hypothetical protein
MPPVDQRLLLPAAPLDLQTLVNNPMGAPVTEFDLAMSPNPSGGAGGGPSGVVVHHSHSGSGGGSNSIAITQMSSAVSQDVIHTERAQQSLLNALIEANAIYSFYIDQGAPNELRLTPALRRSTRAALDQLLFRAATHQHQFYPSSHPLLGRPTSVEIQHLQQQQQQQLGHLTASQRELLLKHQTSGGSQQQQPMHGGAPLHVSTTGHNNSQSGGSVSQPQTARSQASSAELSTTATAGHSSTTVVGTLMVGGSHNQSQLSLVPPVSVSASSAPTLSSPVTLHVPTLLPTDTTPGATSTTTLATTTTPTMIQHLHVVSTSSTPPTPPTPPTKVATTDDLLQMVPSLHTIAIAPSVPVRVITKKGVSVSTHFTIDEAMELESEVRHVFDASSQVIVAVLDLNSFARFRASDLFQTLIASFHGMTADGRSITPANANALTPREALGIVHSSRHSYVSSHHAGGDPNNNNGGNHANTAASAAAAGTASHRNRNRATVAPAPLHVSDDHALTPPPMFFDEHGNPISGMVGDSSLGDDILHHPPISPQYPVSHHLRGFISSGGQNSVLAFGPGSRIGVAPGGSPGSTGHPGRASIVSVLRSTNSQASGGVGFTFSEVTSPHGRASVAGSGNGGSLGSGMFFSHSVTPSDNTSIGFGGAKMLGHQFLESSQRSLSMASSVPNSPQPRSLAVHQRPHASPPPIEDDEHLGESLARIGRPMSRQQHYQYYDPNERNGGNGSGGSPNDPHRIDSPAHAPLHHDHRDYDNEEGLTHHVISTSAAASVSRAAFINVDHLAGSSGSNNGPAVIGTPPNMLAMMDPHHTYAIPAMPGTADDDMMTPDG